MTAGDVRRRGNSRLTRLIRAPAVLIFPVVLSMLMMRVALADCTVVTGNETAGCTVSGAGQTLTIQGGATLNGYISMTGAGTALTVNNGGTFQFLAGLPGQPLNLAVSATGANAVVTNNGTLAINTNVFVDVLALNGTGFNVVNGPTGLISNNSLVAGTNAVTNFTAGVSGTLTNFGTIRASAGGGEGAIFMAGAGGVFTLDNRAGATIQGLNSFAVNVTGTKVTNLRNAGTIATGVVNGTAISLGTGADTVTLEPTSAITGIVNAGAGIDTLALGGTALNGSFNIGQIGPAVQYRNFETFQKVETGTWTLTGTGGVATAWTVTGGTLRLGSSTLGMISLTAAGGDIAYANGVVMSSPVVLNTATSLIVDGADSATQAGVVSGAGSMTKSGTGTLLLTGANTYAGGTAVNDGVLQVSSDANLGAAAGSLSFDGGTLRTTATFGTTRTTTLNAGGGTFETQAGTMITHGGAISGAGGLTKTGDGSLMLTGTGTYIGGTTISAGTLQLGNGGTSGSIVGDVVNNAALVANRSDTLALGGDISGTGTVTQAGFGTTILTGTNTYTGGTTISAGTLQLGNGGTSGSIVGNVLNNGILTFNRIDTSTFSSVISGTGTVTQTGTGTTILTGANTYTGGTTISAGTLQLGDGGTSGSIVGNVLNNGTLAFNRSDTSTFGGVISGTGSVVQAGSGTTILTAINPYTGGTTVAAGTLAVGGPTTPTAALSGGGPIAVATGATLGGYGSVTGTVTNAGTIAAANATMLFAGGPTGSFTVNGTLINAGLAALGGTGIGNQLVVSNYVGQNGRLALNARLGADGSPSDRLVINGGTATGNTSILVTNVGGGGAVTAGDGIQVVQANNGATTSAGAFTLGNRGGYVPAGPYAYTLFRGGRDASSPESWYLRSTLDCTLAPNAAVCQSRGGDGGGAAVVPNFRPEVALYAATPGLSLAYGASLLDTLNERLGERLARPCSFAGTCSATQPELGGFGWARVVGGKGNRDGSQLGIYGDKGPSYDYSLYFLQAGFDLFRHEAPDGAADHAGLYGAFGQMTADATHFNGLPAGQTTLYGKTVGLYLTHFAPQGWYLDLVGQGTWYDINSTSPLSGLGLTTSGFGFGTSLEGGWPLQLSKNWRIEPQVQLVYQKVNLAGSAERGGLASPATQVQFGGVESLAGRLGVRLVASWTFDDEAGGRLARHATGWLRASVLNEFLANPLTEFSSDAGFVPFNTNLMGPAMQLKAGFDGELMKGVSAYFSLGSTIALNSQSRAYEGKLGIKAAF